MQKLCWVLLLVPFLSWSQEADSTAMDTVAIDTTEKEPPPYYLGVYATGGGSFEPSGPGHNLVSTFGVGVQYERWAVEFSRHDFQGSLQAFVVFPNVFELKYRYGGAAVAYRFYENKKIGMWLRGQYMMGDMTWRNIEDGQDFLRDEFSLMKIGARGEFLKLKYVKPHVMVGYQKVRNLNLSGIAADAFSGLYFGLGIRVGYFNQ